METCQNRRTVTPTYEYETPYSLGKLIEWKLEVEYKILTQDPNQAFSLLVREIN
jgi:hypothetical protein